MLAPRPTELRSQRDINLWRIPLQLSLAAVVLFGITLIPDTQPHFGIELRIRFIEHRPARSYPDDDFSRHD